LPCDIVCELPGHQLLTAWMVRAASLPGGPIQEDDDEDDDRDESCERTAYRNGGLGVWYETRREGTEIIKSEETDFVAVIPDKYPIAAWEQGTLLPNIQRVALSTPTDSLRDVIEEQKGLVTRHSLIKRHPQVQMLSTRRDAHIYVLPRWVLHFVAENDKIETIGEDMIGWWAKATWQYGLADNLGLTKALTTTSNLDSEDAEKKANSAGSPPIPETPALELMNKFELARQRHSTVPPLLAYLPPDSANAPLIRRVDNTALLLEVSLRLAQLPSLEEASNETASPFAHMRKVAYPQGVKARTTISRADCLIGDNTTIGERTTIKACVIGAGCRIGDGARLTQCLLMDGVVVNDGCRLTRCVVGKRAVIGNNAVLTECEVQENLLVEKGGKQYHQVKLMCRS